MAVKLESPTARFQHTAASTRRFFAAFKTFADDLDFNAHPEAINQAAVSRFRNELIAVRSQWEAYEAELIDACEQLAEDPISEPVRMRVPSESDIQAGVGCIAVAVAGALVVGVVLGCWIG